jgi:RNA polymerase sigma-70 factor (ECF subfamily)
VHGSELTRGRELDAGGARRGDEEALLTLLHAGDEKGFAELVDRYGAGMLRFARMYAGDEALAEDCVQDAWLGVLRGIDRFERRSSLRTWIFRILLNRLRTRLQREGRFVSLSFLDDLEHADREAAVEGSRFLPLDHPRWPRHWKHPPVPWNASPEEVLLAKEVHDLVARALDALPQGQRQVMTLRDVEGWGSAEVCELLGLTEANQRVLLHRARARVRRALENHFTERSP